MTYVSVNEMATPVSMSCGVKPGGETHATMPDSEDGMTNALEAEMEKCARLQDEVAELKSELDKTQARVAVQSKAIDALTNQLRDALSLEGLLRRCRSLLDAPLRTSGSRSISCVGPVRILSLCGRIPRGSIRGRTAFQVLPRSSQLSRSSGSWGRQWNAFRGTLPPISSDLAPSSE